MKKNKSFSKQKSFPILSAIIIVIFLFNGIFGGLITSYDAEAVSLTEKLIPPFFMPGGSINHILGTDILGRDVLSRIIIGGSISLEVAVASIIIGGGIGTILGILAGFYGKWVDVIIMRMTDAALAFPGILLALLLSLSIGTGVKSAIISIAFSMWAKYTRTVRTEVKILKEKNYVKQSRIMGASDFWIILKHLLPNVKNTIIVMLTMDVGMSILTEASLSFLSLSVVPPTPSWGQMIADGKDYFLLAPWIAVFPAIATIITVMAFQSFGDYIKGKRGVNA